MDSDGIGAPAGSEQDVLDTVDVHRDVADIAEEPDPRAVRRDIDVLVDVRAIEQQRVVPALTLDRVAAIAWVPDERVVSGAVLRRVVAAPAGNEVVAITANQDVVAVAARDRVVARAAVERELNETGEAIAGGDDVIATIGVQDEILGGADVEGERRGVGASEKHARAVRRYGEGLVAVATIDLGGIGAVAALEQVAAVARVPDHAVVAALAEHLVVAWAASERVVAVTAEQQVVAALAKQDVVAVLAE